MRRTGLIFRRELLAYFNTPVAYVALALLVGGVAFFFFEASPFFATERAEMRDYFEFMPLALMVFVPAVTMRLWSEEIRTGTVELLLTWPFKGWEVVLGKFLAAYAVVVLALVLGAGIPASVAWLGDPDWGPIAGGYLGTLLLGATFVAVGSFASSLTENQVVALLVSVFVGVFLVMVLRVEFIAYLTGGDSTWIETVRLLGVRHHFDSIERGVLAVEDILYFLTMTAFFLLLTVYRVETRRY